MAYGSDIVDNFRRASYFVDRILRGTKVSELPIEYPTKFELTINLKTAKALGLTIPETLLATADEVIQAAAVHRGARERGGVASRGKGAAVELARDRVPRRSVR